jgi:hypothetical protein
MKTSMKFPMEKSVRYYIYSPTKGWYMGFHQRKHVFNMFPDSKYFNFISRSGAKGMMDCMVAMDVETTPNDLTVVSE